MPNGAPNYVVQGRTDFVAESSDGYIYLCWVDGGINVARSQAGTESWTTLLDMDDPTYDSPTIYIDSQDRVFVAARKFLADIPDQVRLLTCVNGTDFGEPETIFEETGITIDPGYLTLKGDTDDNLFLTFPYRPDSAGARAAIIAGNPGGTIWTDIFVLTDPHLKHPVMSVRPDGSIEVCYAYPSWEGPNAGSTDTPFSEMNYIYGRSHPGFID
jgi:hypothetical protein